MFEIDDDFDIDEVMLDTVSIIEEEAIRATNSMQTDQTENLNTQQIVASAGSLDVPLKCPVKRKSDTEVDQNAKLPKRSSQDCLQLLQSIRSQPMAQRTPESPKLPKSTVNNLKSADAIPKCQSPKPTTVWKAENKGNGSCFGMRTIAASCQRKFPGPAGLLPERANRVSYASVLNESGHQDTSGSEIPLLSQSTQTLDVGPWQALRFDLQEAKDILDKYTVSWVKQRLASRRLAGQKIPFLAAVLHNIDTSSPDPIIVLRDKTGFLNGSVHRSVWECYGGQLVQGSALILRLVGVACTGSATQQRLYVNVTSNNIGTIYSPSSEGDVKVTEVNPIDFEEIRERVKEWETKCKAEAAAAAASTAQNSSLFSSTLTDRTPLRQIAPASPRPVVSTPKPAAIPVRPPAQTSSVPPQKPATTFNLQRTLANSVQNNSVARTGFVPKKPIVNSAGTSGFVPKQPTNLPKSSESPKPDQTGQGKIVSSTQASDADVNLEVSSFLDGLDTDLLFDDF